MTSPGRKPTISDAQICRAIRILPDPAVTAKEVSEQIDMTRQGVRERMDGLIKNGYVKRKEVGSRAVVYWLTDEGKQLAAEG